MQSPAERFRLIQKLTPSELEGVLFVLLLSCTTNATFLFPNKKVAKEIGIGEALMPRSRASNTPSPMYLSRGALGFYPAT